MHVRTSLKVIPLTASPLSLATRYLKVFMQHIGRTKHKMATH